MHESNAGTVAQAVNVGVVAGATIPDASLQAGATGTPAATPPPLSAEARRIRDGLGVPIATVPGIEAEDPAYLREHSSALNRVIMGEWSGGGVWNFLRRHLPEPVFCALHASARPAFSPLWERSELEALGEKCLPDLEKEWRARMRVHPRWGVLTRVIREEPDYAAIWYDVLGGDFDLRGRGADYTRGMEAFQASRWLGARTLLRLLGTGESRQGIYLDVLGGDGYVWRLMEAEKGVTQTRLVIVEHERFFFEEGAAVPDEVLDLVSRMAAADTRVPILLVRAADGEARAPQERTYRARLLLAHGGDLLVFHPEPLRGETLLHLVETREAVWMEPGTPEDAIPSRATEITTAARCEDGDPRIITNDISPHMFYRAGLWGVPTREDATRLSRTFLPDSLDGVLFAYGTHHIPDMFEATQEGFAILRPGGTVVVHDFVDEGPAGQWFHQVVDKHSKTGHDIPHIGPIQMAVVLFTAGFHHVSLYEIQDPFFFASETAEAGVQAKDLALSYLLGMYGMGESFEGRLGEFEEIVKTVLTYPEVGEVPVFTPGFVYVPRRAVVARARKPGSEGAGQCSERDRVLIHGISELFRLNEDQVMFRADAPQEVRQYWFGADGSRWGISPERQRQWLEWADSLGPAERGS